MNIVLLAGSAHRSGTTAALAREFQRGAEDAGHEVFRFDTAFREVHPCIGCDRCRREGVCTFAADDMKRLNPHLLAAEAVVFVSPIYYFDLSAQLKAVIDRFYANDDALHGGKRALLLTAMADEDLGAAEGADATFRSICAYLQWENAGILNAAGASTAEDLTEEDLRRAYDLGKDLK